MTQKTRHDSFKLEYTQTYICNKTTTIIIKTKYPTDKSLKKKKKKLKLFHDLRPTDVFFFSLYLPFNVCEKEMWESRKNIHKYIWIVNPNGYLFYYLLYFFEKLRNHFFLLLICYKVFYKDFVFVIWGFKFVKFLLFDLF